MSSRPTHRDLSSRMQTLRVVHFFRGSRERTRPQLKGGGSASSSRVEGLYLNEGRHYLGGEIRLESGCKSPGGVDVSSRPARTRAASMRCDHQGSTMTCHPPWATSLASRYRHAYATRHTCTTPERSKLDVADMV